MNDAVLTHFRALADALRVETADWQWIGPHLSQRMFGITEARARAYAAQYGGQAQRMTPQEGAP
jgi:hypothetical protein